LCFRGNSSFILLNKEINEDEVIQLLNSNSKLKLVKRKNITSEKRKVERVGRTEK
jgi:hypothetical protein